jgi:hypothetical protein
MTPLALVHLVRQVNGPAPFERFLASYRAHDPGVEHELVLLFKGFSGTSNFAPYLERAEGLNPRVLQIDDAGVDLTAYLTAARMLDHQRVCFVNSFSVIRSQRWLGLLSGALASKGVGIAGATGSWGSHRAGALLMLRLPAGLGERGCRREMLAALRTVGADDQPLARTRPFRTALELARQIALFPRFPAAHIRTNAFAIERELLISAIPEAIPNKEAAYRLEAGKRSLTARIEQRGLRAVVVGRDGGVHDREDWPALDLFWQADQSDVLVADNQTIAYDQGSPAERRALSRFAWGDRARPSPGSRGGCKAA